ncbi:MAG: hypothetical protein V3T90_02395 [Anaerolineae bacterium]
MSQTVMIHLLNEDAVVAEIERVPEPNDQVLIVSNVRLRDGRDVSYILPETNTVIYPWTRIHCVEILPGEKEEKIIGFVRE